MVIRKQSIISESNSFYITNLSLVFPRAQWPFNVRQLSLENVV